MVIGMRQSIIEDMDGPETRDAPDLNDEDDPDDATKQRATNLASRKPSEAAMKQFKDYRMCPQSYLKLPSLTYASDPLRHQ